VPKYSFDYPVEITHCLKCPLLMEDDLCGLQDESNYKNWEKQKANCPLKNEPEKLGCTFDE